MTFLKLNIIIKDINNLKGHSMIAKKTAAKLKNSLQAQAFTDFQAWALLIMRLIMGIAFILHGWGKIQNPFGWMPPTAPVPGILQGLAALAEFGGGIALILGLFTRIAAFGLAITMVVATLMHAVVLKDPFVNMTGGASFEPALGYLGISLLFLAMGPGKYSLDFKLFTIRA